jgi:hypothetical protein
MQSPLISERCITYTRQITTIFWGNCLKHLIIFELYLTT